MNIAMIGPTDAEKIIALEVARCTPVTDSGTHIRHGLKACRLSHVGCSHIQHRRGQVFNRLLIEGDQRYGIRIPRVEILARHGGQSIITDRRYGFIVIMPDENQHVLRPGGKDVKAAQKQIGMFT
jgi:hypothetical protein